MGDASELARGGWSLVMSNAGWMVRQEQSRAIGNVVKPKADPIN